METPAELLVARYIVGLVLFCNTLQKRAFASGIVPRDRNIMWPFIFGQSKKAHQFMIDGL
ncbi:hypothetical protein DXA79_08625 [Bifidobacterium pseudocatenulatum]|uniref:Uncharacterized protein n=1 Tax=Bifidobacterium pseudocatenulatum TaxID=28026 RepID=A0A3E5HJ46_BIFPS|nr:hypothetical protein DXA79_08625 [Bifidobacterium pseudocatenulatum]RGT67998.1 hypothetical protein DWX12_06010 [Bifidobacterium pseudocatenulatum]